MGREGPGNFDCGSAWHTLVGLMDQLIDECENIISDESDEKDGRWNAMDYDEEADSALLPNIEILCVLYEKIGIGSLPEPETVQRWTDRYLPHRIAEDTGAERLKVVKATFRRLMRNSKKLHDQ